MRIIHIILTAIISMLLMTAASAGGVGSIDLECQRYGFDYGIVKYEWNSTTSAYEQEAPTKAPYMITLTGNSQAANWTANPPVAGVLTKMGQDYATYAGGNAGTVSMGEHAISHITFCGNDTTTVPESGILIGIISLLIPGTIYLARKRTAN
jgi:hypothetical protein